MILADKIIDLRKKNGWSQEELADKLGVSRQSISKWEGAQSVPDLNRIIAMSQIFGVSTDYLLKEEELPAVTGESMPLVYDEPAEPVRSVSMEEANTFLKLKDRSARRVAFGVMLCILSPILLIVLTSCTEEGIVPLSEVAAAGVSLIVLMLLVAAAVALFVIESIAMKPFEYMERDNLDTAYGVDGMVRERKMQYTGSHTAMMTAGIALCVLSAVPIFVGMILAGDSEKDYLMAFGVGGTLLFVALGVLMIVRTSIYWGAMQQLLEEGDYTRENKLDNRKNELIATVYWCSVIAVYLGISFLGILNWDRSWIVWPIAGVSYGVLTAVLRILRQRR